MQREEIRDAGAPGCHEGIGPAEGCGESSIVMETAVLRGTRRDPVDIGSRVLIGPRAYLVGASVDDDCFLATGATVFNGARLGSGCEVRINGPVHLRTVLPPGTLVQIGWVAVGDPPVIAAPDRHKQIWAAAGAGFPRLRVETRADGRRRLTGYPISGIVTDDGAADVRCTWYRPPASLSSSGGVGIRCGKSVVDRVTRMRCPAAIVARVGKTSTS
jgi:carbonic anhydrase/acetyltransferase-like protein (isoleucine patch superfamily)